MHIESLFALKPGPPPRDVVDILKKFSQHVPERWIVRCPACSWQPVPSSRWSCLEAGPPENFGPGCGEIWHSFETRGTCPGCAHHWKWTACLACSTWSRHEDWYTLDESDGS
jgi:hypothetical protein